MIDRSIPVEFNIKNVYETNDDRYIEVLIKLMHTEENYNGSFFSKEVVEAAIPSLANTPILAYIETNSEGEKDFSDHREILVKEDGQYKIKYIGQAIGVIPETNNARFEKYTTESGIEREYLVVDGLLWTKWDDPIDIMLRDKNHQQSMELHKNYQGRFEDDSLFHFTYFQFYGACALSNIGILPAMEEASIELKYTFDDFHKEIQGKMEQFKQYTMNQFSNPEIDNINSNNKEGGKDLVDEKLELLKKYSLTVENISFSIENLSLEEIESKIAEHFSLLASQKEDEIINALRVEKFTDRWGDEYTKYSYVNYNDTEVFAYDRQDNWNLYGFTYSMSGDSIVIDFSTKKRKKFEIVDFIEGQSIIFNAFPQEAIDYAIIDKEKEIKQTTSVEFETLNTKVSEFESTITMLNAEINTLKTVNEELSTYKNNNESELHINNINEVFSDFEESLKDNEKYTTLKSAVEKDIMNFNVDNLRKDLLAILGELNFSKTNKKSKPDKIVAPVIDTNGNDEAKSRYGKYEQYIEKQN